MDCLTASNSKLTSNAGNATQDIQLTNLEDVLQSILTAKQEIVSTFVSNANKVTKLDKMANVCLLKLVATMLMEDALLAVPHSSMFLPLKVAKLMDVSNTLSVVVKNAIMAMLCFTTVANCPTA